MADRCRFKEYVCHKCNSKGHLARVCISKTAENVTRVASQMEENGRRHRDMRRTEGENNYTTEDEIHFVYQFSSKKPYKIKLEVNNTNMEFEIDTGSGKTVISESLYREKFNHVELEPTKIVLKTYSKEILKIMGKLMVNITHEGRMVDAVLYVIAGNGPTLLGRDILLALKN